MKEPVPTDNNLIIGSTNTLQIEVLSFILWWIFFKQLERIEVILFKNISCISYWSW